MSHVDEGELTAYADGAYAPDSADAQRIAAHVAACANCRNRLDEARALSGRASEILAAAAPLDITMPDFAKVRAAAASVRRRQTAIPLTWAATVILALGLGWFGRGAIYEPVQQSVVSSARSTEAAADMTAAAPEPAAAVPQLREQPAPGSGARRSTPAMQPERQEMQAANALSEATEVAPAAAPPTSVAPAERDFARAEERALVGRAQGAAVANVVDYMTAAEAERRGVALHVIPELEVLRVGVRADEVVVEQKLPDGKVLSITSAPLIHAEGLADAAAKRAAVAPSAPTASAARARDEVTLQKVALQGYELTRGNVRLRLSAALPEDSLRALAAKLR